MYHSVEYTEECSPSVSSSSLIWYSGGASLTSLADSLDDHIVSISLSSSSLPLPTCFYSPSSTISLPSVTPEWCEKPFAQRVCQLREYRQPSILLLESFSVISFPLASTLNSSISTSTFSLYSIFNIQYSSAPCAVHTRTCCPSSTIHTIKL